MDNRREIVFSPPDMTDEEVEEVKKALLSGWITTGPKTKELENKLADFCGTGSFVCFSSATAAMEMTTVRGYIQFMPASPADPSSLRSSG